MFARPDRPDDELVPERKLDPETREAFQRYYTKQCVGLLRRNVPMVVLVVMGFLVWDLLISSSHLYQTALVRLALSTMFLAAFVGTFREEFDRVHDMVLLALLFGSGVGIAWILYILPNGFEIGVAGVALCFMGASGFFRLPGPHTVVGGVMVIVATGGLMVIKGEPGYLIASNAIFIAAFVLFCVIVNVQTRRDALSIYLYQQRLEEEKTHSETLVERITGMRKDRIEWLENLARFLRHEMKNQIVGVRTSLGLLDVSESPKTVKYVERAQESLGRMHRLVSSATEATSLEAALVTDSVSRVNLMHLVDERIVSFRQAYPNLMFTDEIGEASVDGNEDRLIQMLDKLLANAVEHTETRGEIRVSLETRNGASTLAIENEGPPLPDDREQLFFAFVSAREGGTAENLGLGLYVAKVIAEGHGGSITASDLENGKTGARFEVRLPLAASG